MSDTAAAPRRTSAEAHRAPRIVALAAVTIGLLLLAAAAFVLSYAGIHATALNLGVSASLARLYPLIFDAMLVVAGSAVLSLRGAGLVSRCYALLVLVVLIGAAAGADTVHATDTHLPHRQGAAAAAIIPWALVLIGFTLLLAMLRHGRLRRQLASTAQPTSTAQPATTAQAGNPARGGDSVAGRATDDGDPVSYGRDDIENSDLAIYAEADLDDPTSDEASAVSWAAASVVPRAPEEAQSGRHSAAAGARPTAHAQPHAEPVTATGPAAVLSPAPTPDPVAEPARPQLDRMWSAPTPPEE